MRKYGLRTFMKHGEPHVTGLDGTTVRIWRAIAERAIGSVFLRRKELRFLEFAETYLVQTAS